MSIWEKLGFGGYKGFSHESDQLLRSAVELAGNLGCEKADTGHLLLAILQQDHGAAARFLEGKQIREPEVRRQLAESRRAPALHHGLRHHRGTERAPEPGRAGTSALRHAGG